MFFDEYQALTEKTLNRKLSKEDVVHYCVYGLSGESGEAIEVLKKHNFHGHELKLDKLKEELGDTLWYLARLAATFNLSLEDIAVNNIEKLKRRYPQGFSEDRSINRDE